MMGMRRVFLLSVLVLSACQPGVRRAVPSDEALRQEARQVVARFAGELKPKLKQALANGGPAHAIEVCSRQAPALTRRLSRETGWRIRRVSLRPRNQRTAVPDPWERSVLERFDRERAAGAAPASLTATRHEGDHFRFMQAQVVGPLCLTCHGRHVAPDVREVLHRLYPGDQALGYEIGQVRGAFSLSKRVD